MRHTGQTSGGAPDRDLVLEFQRGEERAYDLLYERHIARVRRICHRMLDNPADAEEAVQETFLRAYQALGRFNGRYQVGAWLGRIAANVCCDHLRSTRRHGHVVEIEEESEEVHDARMPDAVVPDQIEMESTLKQIQPLHARALLLRALKGLSHREMAGELDMTPEQVKALLHRARTSFRRAWQQASGWVLAPLFALRSIGTRSDEATASHGVALGLSPASGIMFEKFAASAMAAALALAGLAGSSAPDTTEQERLPERAQKVRPQRVGEGTTGAPANDALAAATSSSDAPDPSTSRPEVLDVPAVIAQALEENEPPEEPTPPQEDDDRKKTGGPTTTSKKLVDKAREVAERVEDQLP